MDTVAAIEPSSTTLDPGAAMPSAAGGGTPREVNETPSLRDSIAAAVKEATQEDKSAEKPDASTDAPKDEAKPEKGAEKAEKPEADKKAPERGEGGKFVAKEVKDEGEPKADAKDPEAKAEAKADEKPHVTRFPDPPKSFQADSREVWRNVPRSVQRDIDAMARDSEAREIQYRETAQRYEAIKPYDDLARSNGRDLKDSLERVHKIENLMQRNPLQGLNAILMEIGPRKADGQPVSLYEVARHIVEQGPEGYQRMMAQQPEQRQQNQHDPQVIQLQQRIAQMEAQQLASSVIEPFKADHPRFEELQEDIAFFLKSGKIPQSLSHYDRLALAYGMAERINPPSRTEPSANDDPGPGADARRADPDFSGSKSIKSAPGSVIPDEEPERGGSIREQLERAIRNQRRA